MREEGDVIKTCINQIFHAVGVGFQEAERSSLAVDAVGGESGGLWGETVRSIP